MNYKILRPLTIVTEGLPRSLHEVPEYDVSLSPGSWRTSSLLVVGYRLQEETSLDDPPCLPGQKIPNATDIDSSLA